MKYDVIFAGRFVNFTNAATSQDFLTVVVRQDGKEVKGSLYIFSMSKTKSPDRFNVEGTLSLISEGQIVHTRRVKGDLSYVEQFGIGLLADVKTN